MGYALIPLNQGRRMKVDIEDFERLYKFKWRVCNSAGYEWVCTGDRKTYSRVANMLCDVPRGSEIHHKNGDTLDNRKSNLRIKFP